MAIGTLSGSNQGHSSHVIKNPIELNVTASINPIFQTIKGIENILEKKSHVPIRT
jgi:hypothetical protein